MIEPSQTLTWLALGIADGTRPKADNATAHVTPIPSAPRMRRSHFPMIASGSRPTHYLLTSSYFFSANS